MEPADLSNMFKKAFKSVCTWIIVISPDILSPTPSTSSAMNTPENTQENRNDAEPADKEDIQYPSK